nr:NADH dehydrogenase subunit 2 [Sophianus sp.]
MKKSSKMLFLSLAMLSTMMVLNTTNWINMWIGMEINLMSFIPMMSKSNDKTSSQGMMMYFLIQSMASILFVTSCLTLKHIHQETNLSQIIMMTSMMMKLGVPPFHQWFIEMINKSPWNIMMFLMSWQKLAPMHVTSNLINKLSLTFMIAATTTSSMFGINQTSTRKIMAYSSVGHMGWIMACAKTFKKSWILYLMLYTLIVVMMCMMLKFYNIMHINQFTMSMKTPMEKLSFLTSMMSMGGLPPFLGFMPKWMAIQNMLWSKEMMILTLMITSTIITLSYYLFMILPKMTTNNQSQKWTTKMKTSKTLSMNLTLNILLPISMSTINFS